MASDNGFGDLELVRTIRTSLKSDSPVDLLNLCSVILSTFREDPYARLRGGGQQSTQEQLEFFVNSLTDTPELETTALLSAIEAMLTDGPLRKQVTAELKKRKFPLPAWLTKLGQAKINDTAYVAQQYAREFDYCVFELNVPGADPVGVSVAIDQFSGGTVEDVAAVPASQERIMEIMRRQQGDDFRSIEKSDLRRVHGILDSAVGLGAMTIPEPESETWPGAEPLLRWLMSLMPGPTHVDLPEVTQPQIDALVDEFLDSPSGARLPDEPDTASVAESVVFLAHNYHSGDALAWSPARVSDILGIVARKVFASVDYLSRYPNVLKAFATFSLTKQGAPAALIDDTVAAVEEITPDFLRDVAEDDVPWGEDLGLDWQLPSVYERAVARVGGPEEAEKLTDDPLPAEEFDPNGIPSDVLERVEEWLAGVESYADAHAEEPDADELRTAYYRLLADLARADPDVFRRRANVERGAAGIVAAVHRTNRTAVTAASVQKWFGLKTALIDRLSAIESGVGLYHGYSWELTKGKARYLIGQVRAELLEQLRKGPEAGEPVPW